MKSKIYFISLFVMFLFVLSCQKDEIEQGVGTKATWFNKTGVSIQYLPFYKGSVVTDYIFTIENNDSFLIGDGYSLILGSSPGFISKYSMGMDSLCIVYDNKYAILHMGNYPDSLLQEYQLSYKNERHIGNPKNYKWWFDERRRKSIHEFVFTKEDYEFAKEYGKVMP